MRIEPGDIVIILFVAFLFFGGISRLPETTRAIGKAVREFRMGIAGKSDGTQPGEKQGKA